MGSANYLRKTVFPPYLIVPMNLNAYPSCSGIVKLIKIKLGGVHIELNKKVLQFSLCSIYQIICSLCLSKVIAPFNICGTPQGGCLGPPRFSAFIKNTTWITEVLSLWWLNHIFCLTWDAHIWTVLMWFTPSVSLCSLIRCSWERSVRASNGCESREACSKVRASTERLWSSLLEFSRSA